MMSKDTAGSNDQIMLPISLALLRKLHSVLLDHHDEGPYGEGWASDELKELRELTKKALEDAK